MTRTRVPSLRRRLLTALVLFLIALTAVITAFTVISNERAEKFTWNTMLGFEMDRVERSSGITDRAIPENQIHYYAPGASMPAPFRGLAEGLHDDVKVDGKLFAVLVRGSDASRRVLAVDVSSIEKKEHLLAQQVILTGIGLMLILSTIAVWGLTRFMRPLRTLSQEIRQLQPERTGQALPPIANATAEINTISESVNGFVARNEEFLQREREFINTASHELRTPIAILRNNLQLIRSEDVASGTARERIARSTQIVDEMESLLGVLLVLARDPSRLAPMHETIALRALVNEVVDAHRHLLGAKELDIRVHGDGGEFEGPRQIATIAVGNIIRNAIENSDRGVIDVEVSAPAKLRVTDPGHGMSPAEISKLYQQAARDPSRAPQLGVGLQLLARICSHLNWQLNFTEAEDGRTQASLLFPAPENLG